MSAIFGQDVLLMHGTHQWLNYIQNRETLRTPVMVIDFAFVVGNPCLQGPFLKLVVWNHTEPDTFVDHQLNFRVSLFSLSRAGALLCHCFQAKLNHNLFL